MEALLACSERPGCDATAHLSTCPERRETGGDAAWEGAEALRPFLAAIDSLEPWPGNPRRGDVEQVRASLRRFGQVRAVLVDGARIVAGHHVVQAAREEGWTHVAAITNEFASEDEARAYLLADNRLPDLGGYDDELLAAQLRALADADVPLEGIGYDEETAAGLTALAAVPVFPPSEEPPPALDARSATTGEFEVPLRLGSDVRRDFANWVRTLEREGYADGVTGVVVRAVREAAQRQ